MILANYSQVNRNCNRDLGSAFSNPIAVLRPWNLPNETVADTADIALQYSGFNNGYNGEASYSLPLKSGGISSINNATGTGTVTATALAVRLAVAALSGSGTISNAQASRIIQLLAALSGSGGVSSANLQAFLQAVASLTGSGGVSSADLEGFGALLATLTGSGTATGSTLTGIGELGADITVTGTGLTTANVGEAVFGTLIEGGYSAGEILKLIAAAAAGKLNGAPGGPIEIKGVDGSTIRISSTVDGDGNRLTVTYDVS